MSPSLFSGAAEAKPSAGNSILASLEGRAPEAAEPAVNARSRAVLYAGFLIGLIAFSLWLFKPGLDALLAGGRKLETAPQKVSVAGEANAQPQQPAAASTLPSTDAAPDAPASVAAALVTDLGAARAPDSQLAPGQALKQALLPDNPMPPENALSQALAPAAGQDAATVSSAAAGQAAALTSKPAKAPVKARPAAKVVGGGKSRQAPVASASRVPKPKPRAAAKVSAQDPDVDILESIMKNVHRSERLKASQARKAKAVEKPAHSAGE